MSSFISQEKKADFSKRFLELFRIASPLIIDQVFLCFMGIVSTIMVASVGEFAISAVSMIDSISNVLISLFFSLATGATIVVAQFLGSRDKESATKAAGQAITAAAIFTLSITIFIIIARKSLLNLFYGGADVNVLKASNQFLQIVNFSFPILAIMQVIFGILRGTGDTKTPMKVSIFMNIINLLLCLVLIKGVNTNVYEILSKFGINATNLQGAKIYIPSFGVTGAAIAITFARGVGLILAIINLRKKSFLINLNKLEYFIPKWSKLKIILSISVPAGIESSLFNLGKLITQIYIVTMGTESVAAYSIAGTISSFANVPGVALSSAVMILVSQRIGRNEEDDVVSTVNFGVIIGMCMLAILSIFGLIFANNLVDLYNVTGLTVEYAKKMLILAFFAMPLFWSSSFVVPAGLRATGDVKTVMAVSISSMWLFRIGAGYVLGVVLGFGVMGAWIAMFGDWIVRTIFFYIRLYSGKWKGKSIINKKQ